MRRFLALALIVCGAAALLGGLVAGVRPALAQGQPPERPTLTPAPPATVPPTTAPAPPTARPDSDDDPTEEPTATPEATVPPTATPAPTGAPTSAPTAAPAPTATVVAPARLPRTGGTDPAGAGWGALGLILLGAGLALARGGRAV